MQPSGFEIDGEVEDYEVVVDPAPDLDFGDAPDPTYPTLLASGGANHLVIPGVFLGNLVDVEPDGQPDPTAVGDDSNGVPNDEDGVTWGPLVPGKLGAASVVASVAGWLDVFVDLDANGAWDPSDLVFSGPVNPGPNLIPVPVPGSAVVGFTFARVRYNTGGALPPGGPAPDGEVEDYYVRIDPPELDFGDAPDTYSTLLASNGPRHVINTGVYMGVLIDAESDGAPSVLADGDDLLTSDDEDGVVASTAVVGTSFQMNMTVSSNGWFDAWVDENQNGVFEHPGELTYSAAVTAGFNFVILGFPSGVPTGPTYLRTRYNLTGPLPPTGFAPDGEVEDYRILVVTQTGLPGDAGLLGFGPVYPNPFSDRVTINFGLAAEERVVVQVYGMDGRLVTTLADQTFGPGQYSTAWDGRNDRGQEVTSGVYFFRLQAGTLKQNQKVLFVR
jgi:hypothetical protein